MEPMNHQLMGYDRAITMFSPDGRLLQVEYAKKTVKQGSTALGMVCKDGIILCSDKRILDPFIIPESVEKIFKIDEHIAATASGILSDARVLVERAQLKAQQNMVTYDTPIDVISVVKDICNINQITTQSGGYRPFGVALLIAGIDNNTPKLFETDPTGIFFQYKAAVIGEGENKVEELLMKDYNENISVEDAIRLSVKLLYESIDNISPERIDCVYIKTDEKKFTRVSKDIITKLLSDLSKSNKNGKNKKAKE